MVHHNSDLFYDICNTKNVHDQTENCCLFIDVSNQILYIESSDWKSSSITSYAFLSIMISMLSLLKCIKCSLLVFLENKVNWYR